MQDAMVGALRHHDVLDSRAVAVVDSYLRRSILNRVRDEVRRRALGEVENGTDDSRIDLALTPAEALLESEERRLFRQGLARLSPGDQALIIGRVELRMTCAELAAELGAASPDAVRMAAKAAVLRLGRQMGLLAAEGTVESRRAAPAPPAGSLRRS